LIDVQDARRFTKRRFGGFPQRFDYGKPAKSPASANAGFAKILLVSERLLAKETI
jgi:hypothetical protein